VIVEALALVADGFRVLPLHAVVDGQCTCRRADCASKGKHPATMRGVHDATTDEATIRRWFAGAPRNIGIATGAGLVVVDVDPRNGGDETIARLEREHGPFPATRTSLTGGGGWHWLFRVDVAPSSLGPGVDVKADGGYVVAAPSIHASGRRYAWDLGAPDWIAPLPAWAAAPASRSPRREPATGAAAISFVGIAALFADLLGRELPDGRAICACPWASEHSDGRGRGRDSSCAVLPPTTSRPLGAWHCSHGHCADRRTTDFLRAVPRGAIDAARSAWPELRWAT
jgi:hypothetical protein